MNRKMKFCALLLAVICLLQGMNVLADDIDILSWTVSTNDETAKIEIVRDNVASGNAALHISTEQTADTHNGRTTKVYQNAAGLEPSTTYRFSFWSKAEHMERYTVVRDIFYSTDARADGNPTYDWVKQDIDFTTSRNATTAAFQFIIAYGDGSKGEVWIDDVSLYKLSDGAPTGENLILNGGFESGIDNVAPDNVTGASVESGDGYMAVSWTDPMASDLKAVNIFVNDVLWGVANPGEEYYLIENVENGQEYKITLTTEDTNENVSDGVVLYGYPKGETPLPDVSADDINNLIIGINDEMEYTVDGGEWTAYSETAQPQLQGTHLVKVRYKETETAEAGRYKVLIFSKEEQAPDGRISVSVSSRGEEITVAGTAEDDRVRIIARGLNDPETIVFVREVETEADGSFEQKFYMPYTAESGHYIVQCRSDNTLVSEPAEFIYTDSDTLENLVERLKNSSQSEILDIFAAETDGLTSLGINVTGYSGLESISKSKVAEEIYSRRSELSQDNIDKIVNSEIAVGLIRQSKTSGEVLEILNTYQTHLELSSDGIPFGQLTDNELIAWICEKICGKDFGGSEELSAYYKKMCAFYVLNNESYVNLGKVLDKYKSELEIENNDVYIRYSNLSSSNKETVNRKVKLANQSYDDTDALINEIRTAINGLGSSGSGSGGGSSGGSGNYEAYVPKPTEDDNNDPGTEEKLFGDLDSVPWAEKEINALAKNGVLSGVAEGVFDPNGTVTREQLAAMIARAFDITSEEDAAFTDVDKDRWSYQYIAALKSKGLINGYDDGTFLPQNNISREDMVLILYRTLIQQYGTLEKTRDMADFTDWAEVSEYAKEGVREMYCMGLVNGIGNEEFAPRGTATRAMAAKILYDIVEIDERS